MDTPLVPVLTHAEVKQRLSANLRRLRHAAGISQERLALDSAVDRTMVSKIERQISNPSVETLVRLSNRLGVDVWVLLHPETEPSYRLASTATLAVSGRRGHALHERGTDGARGGAAPEGGPREPSRTRP